MPDRAAMVSLTLPGTESGRAPGVFTEFTRRQRVKRAVVVMLVATGLAATLIPIPIIHLLGIPLLLLSGALLSVRQLSMVGRLHPLRVACPKCGELNRVGGGLGYPSIAPRERMCDSCRRGLTLQIELGGPVAVVATHPATS